MISRFHMKIILSVTISSSTKISNSSFSDSNFISDNTYGVSLVPRYMHRPDVGINPSQGLHTNTIRSRLI